MSQSHLSFYSAQPWQLCETQYDPEQLSLSETLFAQANGYLGSRGGFEEGGADSNNACYLNGVYCLQPITYGEKAYGYASHNERMVTVPNGKLIELYVDGERFSLEQGTIIDYQRSLDFRNAVLERRLTWRSPAGKTVQITSRRLVSLDDKHLCVIEYQVTALDFSGDLRLVSTLECQLPEAPADHGDDPRAGSAVSRLDIELERCDGVDEKVLLLQRIHSSGFSIASGVTHRLLSEGPYQMSRSNSANGAQIQYECTVSEGQQLCLTKYLAYFSDQHSDSVDSLTSLDAYLDQVSAQNFDHYCALQSKTLDAFWSTSDVTVEGDPSLQQGLRFNLLQLFQSVGRDGKTNIAAKGLSGDGYDGHYFWDTEIYILPFFLYSQPQLARRLLEYRYHILDAARQRARQMAFSKGALFPWRTIGGNECSAYYPAGTAQYHINADIAYAVKRYHEATEDMAFMRDYGAEIVLDSARIWIELGCFDQQQRFCINTVTGPDEYTALVNNNFYTNVMAKTHLDYAVQLCRWLADEEPDAWAALKEKLALEDDEPKAWADAAEAMYLPFDERLGIHCQDDSFLTKKVWDFANTSEEKYPLLLHYHPLVIYRHQVCKQADVVLALLLRSELFSQEQKKRDFDYYEAVTTHDSTLSACIHSIIASEVGYLDKAQDYFREVARMDLDNHHNNTQYGLHTASMGGTWMCMVYGFAGLRVEDNQLSFAPCLPEGMQGYSFRLAFKERVLEVRVSGQADSVEVNYRLVRGAAITIHDRGEAVELLPE